MSHSDAPATPDTGASTDFPDTAAFPATTATPATAASPATVAPSTPDVDAEPAAPRRSYGLPTVFVLLAAFTAFAVYRIMSAPDDHALKWRVPLDLAIYRLGGEKVAEGLPLYDGPLLVNLPFTYPPISGLIFSWMDALSDNVLIGLWQIGGMVALAWIVAMIFRERGMGVSVWTILAAVVFSTATVATEPIHGTLFFGQINIFLMLLVSFDFLPRKFRLPGIGTGLAAGLKLTPAYLGLVFLFQKRWWAAAGSVLTFAVTVVVGMLFVRDGGEFWRSAIFDSSRIGEHSNLGAQSLRSILYRYAGIDGGPVWLLCVAGTFAVTCAAVFVAVRRGNRSVAMALTGVSACLVSPFSWYHHWVWIIPLAACVFAAVNRALGPRFDRAMGIFGAQLAGLLSLAAAMFVLIPFVNVRVWDLMSYRGTTHIDFAQPWIQCLFTLTGLAFIVLYALSGLFGLGGGKGHGKAHSDARGDDPAAAATDAAGF
ncbi:Polyprenol-phosphate-mannose-dependent alpha-(1-2)-phosphatidylinositol mannoside mannosyltransferase [Corynebacterium massiliense DSM 45435]|uniref:Polyprenol-phosphate-mannose-dependent alpha-(1-2)-phosphatidylinositol mannoside mannosyltransferase n=2 Tax=Corynebacterium massiliense TaxID=441501 RepID=A0ABY7U984_9CORY|nr:Polyprenol-phosphate-mannose-dependent alpha-(1-2)-phosphatidylinositol mannoside mannosyltransferase [Corynebacterium massiliense DSM 45435]